MSKHLLLALVALPCLAMAQTPAETAPPPSSSLLEPTGETSDRPVAQPALSPQGPATGITDLPPHDPAARSRRGFLTFLGGAGGAVVTGALTGGTVALLCREDYCGITAGLVAAVGAAVGLPLGAWATGTYFADGDGNLMATYAGALLGLALTLPLHAIPNLQPETHMLFLGLNIAAPLLGSAFAYELTSNESASRTRALQMAGVSLVPAVAQGRKGEWHPAIALSGRFH